MYEIKFNLKDIAGGYYANNIGDLACIIGDQIVRLIQCEVVPNDLPWMRGLMCKEILHLI